MISTQPHPKYKMCRKATERSINTFTKIQISRMTPAESEVAQHQCMRLNGLIASGQRQAGLRQRL